MAKIKQNYFMDMIEQVIQHAKAKRFAHLRVRHLTINAQTWYHLEATSYL